MSQFVPQGTADQFGAGILTDRRHRDQRGTRQARIVFADARDGVPGLVMDRMLGPDAEFKADAVHLQIGDSTQDLQRNPVGRIINELLADA